MKITKDELFTFVLLVLSILGIVVGVVTINIPFIIICGLFLIAAFFLIYCEFVDYLRIRRLNKAIETIKNKKQQTIFEQLSLDAYKGSAVGKIALYLKTDNKQNPYDLDTNFSINKIFIDYLYRGFLVQFVVTDKEITTLIDSPERYDLLEANKELEEKQKIVSDVNRFLSLEEMYQFIANLIEEHNDKVKTFINDNKPDNVINGHTMGKMDLYVGRYLPYLWIYFVCGIFFAAFTVMFTYQTITNEEFVAGSYFGAICLCLVMLFFTILCFKLSSNEFFLINKIKKDLKLKKAINIKGKCVKVKFVIEGKHRSHDKTFKLVFLTLKTDNGYQKVVSYIEKDYVGGTLKRKKLKELLLDKEYNIHCLKNSKMILTGDNYIIKSIKACANVY